MSRQRSRIAAIDTLRGFTVVSMVAFHATYDLAYLYGVPVAWFTQGPAQELWRISISWVFLVLAGWMCSLSRSNLKRGIVYAGAAAAVWAATSIAAVDTPVTFGILFCMAGSTLVFTVVERYAPTFIAGHAMILALVAAALSCCTYAVPHTRYAVDGLAWLGFPNASFASGDYYPLIPFGFLYLTGACAGLAWNRAGRAYPTWMLRDWAPPLTWIGRHSLAIYLLHQPMLLGILAIMMR